MVRTAPSIPDTAVGRKVYYVAVDGRKIVGIVDSVDSITHPSRLNIRITARKDKTYPKGALINTPPAFVMVRT